MMFIEGAPPPYSEYDETTLPVWRPNYQESYAPPVQEMSYLSFEEPANFGRFQSRPQPEPQSSSGRGLRWPRRQDPLSVSNLTSDPSIQRLLYSPSSEPQNFSSSSSSSTSPISPVPSTHTTNRSNHAASQATISAILTSYSPVSPTFTAASSILSSLSSSSTVATSVASSESYSTSRTSVDNALSLQNNSSASTFNLEATTTMPSDSISNSNQVVTNEALRLHLRLMGAFHKMRKVIEGLGSSGITCENRAAGVVDPKARWSVFVAIALGRFEAWLEKILTNSATQIDKIPPLDVAMVWHTYVLNPRCYIEDTERVLSRLHNLRGFPLEMIAESIDKETLEQTTSDSQAQLWLEQTNSPFSPFTNFRLPNLTKTIVDPITYKEYRIPYVNEQGTGYGQQHFKFTTPQGFLITHESLGVARLVQDILNDTDNADYPLKLIAGSLQGTSETRSDPLRHQEARRFKKQVSKYFKTTKSKDSLPPGKDDWTWDFMRKRLGAFERRRVRVIVASYPRMECFSLDLVAAVLRQGSFIEKMVSLGWTTVDRFPDDDPTMTLTRVKARYDAFLDLASSSYTMAFVPTLDIDLAWHTHQLRSDSYRRHTIRNLGRFFDHSDQVEEGALSNSYEITCLAWEKRFKVPYTHCLCLRPETSITKSLKMDCSKGTEKSSRIASKLDIPQNSDEKEATHVSEHDALYLLNPKSSFARVKRANTHTNLVSKQPSKKVTPEFRRHPVAYLKPVDFYSIIGEKGKYPIPISDQGGCGAVDANAMFMDISSYEKISCDNMRIASRCGCSGPM